MAVHHKWKIDEGKENGKAYVFRNPIVFEKKYTLLWPV